VGFVGGGASVGFGEDGKVVSFGENEVGVGSVGGGHAWVLVMVVVHPSCQVGVVTLTSHEGQDACQTWVGWGERAEYLGGVM